MLRSWLRFRDIGSQRHIIHDNIVYYRRSYDYHGNIDVNKLGLDYIMNYFPQLSQYQLTELLGEGTYG